jgi:hypothetical protein
MCRTHQSLSLSLSLYIYIYIYTHTHTHTPVHMSHTCHCIIIKEGYNILANSVDLASYKLSYNTTFITSSGCTVCPTHYRTWHFFNNSNTNEDIATKFEQKYVRCVRNEKECVYSAPNCCNAEQQSTSQPVR